MVLGYPGMIMEKKNMKVIIRMVIEMGYGKVGMILVNYGKKVFIFMIKKKVHGYTGI